MILDPDSDNLPKRHELPKIEGHPEGSAWFWGKDDSKGRLNLLTPKRIAEAAKLVKTGETVGLNWDVTLPNPSLFGRQTFEHKIHQRSAHSFDDIYHMNTQSGSQWDGFRHCGHRGEDAGEGGVCFYNGLKPSELTKTGLAGVGAWAQKGIAGRGILIDYWAHRQKSYSPLSTHSISVTAIREIAASKNITFRPGDILLIRSGFVDHYNTLPQPERDALKDIPPREYTLVGCEQSEEMLTFLHDEYFAAVVGDTPAFESWPSSQSWHLHHTLLPKWGIPMGEMWDLERLAEVCERLGRWEFLVTSAPSNMPGGVASCPNAMALF